MCSSFPASLPFQKWQKKLFVFYGQNASFPWPAHESAECSAWLSAIVSIHEPLGISQPVSSSASTGKSPEHLCTSTGWAALVFWSRACACCSPSWPPFSGEPREGRCECGCEAVTELLQLTALPLRASPGAWVRPAVLHVLLCYTSFLCGPPTFYTVHTHVQRIGLWQFADAITLLQTTCFQVNASSLYQQQGLIFLYKHIKGLICALRTTQI